MPSGRAISSSRSAARGGGVRARVTGLQHASYCALIAPIGTVACSKRSGVAAEPTLEGRHRALFVGVNVHQGGVDVDHQRSGRRGSGCR